MHYSYLFEKIQMIPDNDYKDVVVRRIKKFKVDDGSFYYQLSQYIIKTGQRGYHSDSGKTMCAKIEIPRGKMVLVRKEGNKDIYNFIGPTTVVLDEYDPYCKNNAHIIVMDVENYLYNDMEIEMHTCNELLSIRFYKDSCFNQGVFSNDNYLDVPLGYRLTSKIINNYKSVIIPPSCRIGNLNGPLIISDFSDTVSHIYNTLPMDDAVFIDDVSEYDERIKNKSIFKTILLPQVRFSLCGNTDVNPIFLEKYRHYIGQCINTTRFGIYQTDIMEKLIKWDKKTDPIATAKKWLESTGNFKYVSTMGDVGTQAMNLYTKETYNNPIQNGIESFLEIEEEKEKEEEEEEKEEEEEEEEEEGTIIMDSIYSHQPSVIDNQKRENEMIQRKQKRIERLEDDQIIKSLAVISVVSSIIIGIVYFVK